MLSSSTKLILVILAGALVAVLLTLSSFNMADEQFEPAYILIAYGAPILLLVLVLAVVRSFREMSREPILCTRPNVIVAALGAAVVVIGGLVWGVLYFMVVLFHPTPAL